MNTFKASEARAILQKEPLQPVAPAPAGKRTEEEETNLANYQDYLAGLQAKIAARQLITQDEADVITAKGEDIDQVELVALNWFTHGLPAAAAAKVSVNNSNVPRENRPEKPRPMTKQDAQALMDKVDELKESMDALAAQLP